MTSSFDPSASPRHFVAQPLLNREQGFRASADRSEVREPDLDEQLRAAFEQGREAGRAELPWREAEALEACAAALDEARTALESWQQDWQVAAREASVTLALAIARRLVGYAVQVDRDALAARVEAGLGLVAGPGSTELGLSPEDHGILVQGEARGLARLVQEHGVRLVPDDELRPGQARIRGGAGRNRRVEIDLERALEHVERELRALLTTRFVEGAAEPAGPGGEEAS